MTTPLVQLQRNGAVAVLSVNRADALNALDVPTALAFHTACLALADDKQVRAVILRGEGRSFGVGGDLSAMQGDAPIVAGQLIDAMHASVKILTTLDAPVIAALHGAVAGGSMSLACACDLAIAAEGTMFNLAYTRIGASCDLSSSWHLPRLVGLRHALQIALLSEPIDAAEALRIGLINRVVPAADLARETLALAQRLASGPTLAYGRLKRLFRQSYENDLPAQLDAESEAFRASTGTHDFAEGLAAFLGKRPAAFVGR